MRQDKFGARSTPVTPNATNEFAKFFFAHRAECRGLSIAAAAVWGVGILLTFFDDFDRSTAEGAIYSGRIPWSGIG